MFLKFQKKYDFGNYLDELISFSNLLLNVNNHNNFLAIINSISHDTIINYLNFFTKIELTPNTLQNYFNNTDKLMDLKTQLTFVIKENKNILLFDLEEQYFTIKKNIYYYQSFHEGLILKKISLSNNFLEFNLLQLQQKFKEIKNIIEPQFNISYQNSVDGIFQPQNLSSVKEMLDELEKNTISYKKNLCSLFNVSTSQWQKLFKQYCSHLKSITEDELEQISKYSKKYINIFEKTPVLDKLESTFQSMLFPKFKKISNKYLLTYGTSYLNKTFEGDFCKKILNEQFSIGFINLWKDYRFYFSKNLSEHLYQNIQKISPNLSINKFQFNILLDSFIEENTLFQTDLEKSIKETYRKKDKNVNLLDFDFTTSFLTFNQNFINDILSTYFNKFPEQLLNLEKHISINLNINNNINNSVKKIKIK